MAEQKRHRKWGRKKGRPAQAAYVSQGRKQKNKKRKLEKEAKRQEKFKQNRDRRLKRELSKRVAKQEAKYKDSGEQLVEMMRQEDENLAQLIEEGDLK